ncbi:xylulokinase [Taklimakanibacter lacteus]|uniref:xylulokinase n=1 Tax=Taklimakanibacter lacteus TaxID=2268456 RepID=UPI000E665980
MYLGIDIGTSAVKFILVDAAQEVVASAEEPLAPVQPRPLWSEDDPEKWWQAVATGLDRLARDHAKPMSGVRGIGLSGQMHSAVLLDAADQPVRPAILWNDGRSTREAAELAALGIGLQRETGVLPMPGFTGPKFLWLKRHEPDAVKRTRTLLIAKDFIRLKLSGEKLTDVTDAAGAWLIDQDKRQWSQAALAACGIDAQLLPRLVESRSAGAPLKDDLARRWGLPVNVVIAAGAGDVAAGGIGVGVVNPGDGFVSLGTSAQVFLADTKHLPDPERLVHAFCHGLPDRWFRMAALLNGASPLAAFARWSGEADIAALLQEAEASFTGPSYLLALPYLYGERTPLNDPLARAALVGMTNSTTRADLVQAILESVAFSLADGLDVLTGGSAKPQSLALIGGGARSAFWAKLIASILEVSLVRYDASDRGPAYGAARLARLAVTGEEARAVVIPPPVKDVIAPDPALSEAYRPRIEAFRSLYRALKPVWPLVTGQA